MRSVEDLKLMLRQYFAQYKPMYGGSYADFATFMDARLEAKRQEFLRSTLGDLSFEELRSALTAARELAAPAPVVVPLPPAAPLPPVPTPPAPDTRKAAWKKK